GPVDPWRYHPPAARGHPRFRFLRFAERPRQSVSSKKFSPFGKEAVNENARSRLVARSWFAAIEAGPPVDIRGRGGRRGDGGGRPGHHRHLEKPRRRKLGHGLKLEWRRHPASGRR